MRKGLIFGLVALFTIFMMGCPTDSGPSPSGAASLTSLTVADTPANIASPISGADWDAATNFNNLEDAFLGDVVLASAAVFDTDITIEVAVSGGASAAYIVASSKTTKPTGEFVAIDGGEAEVSMDDGDFLYIRVTAENGNRNYFKFEVLAATSIATVNQIRVNGTAASIATASDEDFTNITPGTFGLGQSAAATTVNIQVNKDSPDAAVYFVHVPAATGVVAEPASWGDALGGTLEATTSVNSVADGDFFCFKIVSGDESKTLYYIIEAFVGRNAALTSVTIGEATFTTLGTPNADAASAVSVVALMALPGKIFAVSAIPAEEGATYQYGVGDDTTEPATYGTAATTEFSEGDFLYIKVTSGNGTILYYKLEIELVKSGEIKYGRPVLTNGTLDALWDDTDLEEFVIERVFNNDSGPWNLESSLRDTRGIAKALWDDDGLYVYWDIDDPSPNNVVAEHEGDSVELFVNEGYQPGVTTNQYSGTYATNGYYSQYRVSRDGTISGDPAVAVTDFTNEGQWEAWERADGTGYIITMYVPWRSPGLIDDTTGYIIDDVWFSMELQINAANKDPNNENKDGRVATLCWNNSRTGNYQNTSGFGIMQLLKPGEGERVVLAQRPEILTHPQSETYYLDEMDGAPANALTVDAHVTKGTLSYQWYKGATAADNTGSTVGTDSSSFTPDISAEGDAWYWCVVTNTDNTADVTTSEATSAKAAIRVFDTKPTIPLEYVIPAASIPGMSVALGGQYSNDGVIIDLTSLPVDVRNYTKVVVDIVAYGKAGTDTAYEEGVTPVNLTWGAAQMKFFTTVVDSVNTTTNVGGQIVNVGASGGPTDGTITGSKLWTGDIPGPVNTSISDILSIGFQTSNGNGDTDNIPAFIRVISVKFTTPVAP